MWRMAFDIGGTSTDFVLAGADTLPQLRGQLGEAETLRPASLGWMVEPGPG